MTKGCARDEGCDKEDDAVASLADFGVEKEEVWSGVLFRFTQIYLKSGEKGTCMRDAR